MTHHKATLQKERLNMLVKKALEQHRSKSALCSALHGNCMPVNLLASRFLDVMAG